MPAKSNREQRDLLSDIKVLEQENQLLMERSEEITLLQSVGDILYASSDEDKIIMETLERVSIFLNIPFCAYGVNEGGVLRLTKVYTVFSDEPIKEGSVHIAPEILEDASKTAQFLTYNYPTKPEIHFDLGVGEFSPVNIGVFGTSTLDTPAIIFVFADDSDDEVLLRNRLDIIRAIKYKVSTRLENLRLRNKLQALNANLEARIDQRTADFHESEARFRMIMHQSPQVIELYNHDGLQIEVNNAYEKLWGFDAATTVNSFNLFTSKEVKETGLLNYVNRAYAGEVVTVPEYQFDPTGETEAQGAGRVRWLSTKIYPLRGFAGNVKNIVITHEDITDRKISEDRLRENEGRYRGLFETSIDGICTLDSTGGYVDVNPAAEKLLGYTKAELIKMDVREIVHPEDLSKSSKYIEKLNTDGFYEGYEGRIISKSGETRNIEVSSIAIHKNGEVVGSHDILRDVTERVYAEAKIAANLTEKEILLQEIQHRTKNNMMVIIALLNMQARELDNPVLDEAFRLTQDRIYAMSLVYDQLQKSSDFAAIDLKHYIVTLTQKLHVSQAPNPSRLKLSVECEAILISLTQAVPVGIILNEIISNALQHGFPEGRQGQIAISVELDTSQQLRIIVDDDGVGISPSQMEGAKKSLGLRLVDILVVDQLSGQHTLESKEGTRHTLEFELQKT